LDKVTRVAGSCVDGACVAVAGEGGGADVGAVEVVVDVMEEIAMVFT
jgi:hypothetical protein